jgi:hypothetical protein
MWVTRALHSPCPGVGTWACRSRCSRRGHTTRRELGVFKRIIASTISGASRVSRPPSAEISSRVILRVTNALRARGCDFPPPHMSAPAARRSSRPRFDPHFTPLCFSIFDQSEKKLSASRICPFCVKLLFQVFLCGKEVQRIEHFLGQGVSECIDTPATPALLGRDAAGITAARCRAA